MLPIHRDLLETGLQQPLLFINSFSFQWPDNVRKMMKLTHLPTHTGASACTILTLKSVLNIYQYTPQRVLYCSYEKSVAHIIVNSSKKYTTQRSVLQTVLYKAQKTELYTAKIAAKKECCMYMYVLCWYRGTGHTSQTDIPFVAPKLPWRQSRAESELEPTVAHTLNMDLCHAFFRRYLLRGIIYIIIYLAGNFAEPLRISRCCHHHCESFFVGPGIL